MKKEKSSYKKGLSCRKATVRHLRIFVSDGMANERKEIRRSRTETLRDDKTLYYNNVNGFTLIELLVVVLIIGILAAVALPQYQKVVERSKATQALTLLKAVAQAQQAYFLANGSYARSFDELSIDIPWTGNTKFLAGAQDTRSNETWSLQLEDAISGGYGFCVYMARITGKYQGATFRIFLGNATTTNTDLQTLCVERKTGANFTFDSSLPAGSYCEKIMRGTLSGDGQFDRAYTLP